MALKDWRKTMYNGWTNNKNLEKIDIIPIIINDYGQPDLAVGSQRVKILRRMGLNSAEIK